MTQILSFLAAFMGYLWDGARFRITGSQVSTSNGGDAVLVVESAVLRLRFVQDRSQLFLDLQSSSGWPKDWFSVDLVRRLYLGQREYSAVLDESYAEFLRDHLADLELRFAPDRQAETYAELEKLKKLSAKERFG